MDQSVLNVCEEGLNTRAVKSRRAYRVKQALEVEIYLTLEVKVSCNRISRHLERKKKRERFTKSQEIFSPVKWLLVPLRLSISGKTFKEVALSLLIVRHLPSSHVSINVSLEYEICPSQRFCKCHGVKHY